MSAIPKNISISDEPFIARVARVSTRRGDSTVTKTLRELADERMLLLEENGDPKAIQLETKTTAGASLPPAAAPSAT